MARSTSDEEIKLRKRARRRLIGAIALTTLVVVTLPMILDSEPRPIGDSVAVDIPSPNVGPFAPKPAPVQPAKSIRPETPAPAAREADKSAAPEPSPQAPAAPAARPAAAPTAQASGAIASAAAPGDMNIAIAGAVKPPAEPTGAQRPAAVAAAPAAKAEPARADTAKPEAAKTDAAKADAAKAEAAKAEAAKAAADKGAKGVENFVIQLGAFAEVDRAKERHAQLVKAGIKSYTEVIKTPTGDKTRVRAGPFPSKEAADKTNDRLKTLGMSDGVVVPRRY